MKPLKTATILAALLLQSLPAFADDVITNLMSPIVSYQYPDDFGSQALTNGGILSPVVSYQYFEWPGDDVLNLSRSPDVSYYYQFLDAPQLLIIQTFRLPTTAESTPALVVPPALQSKLKQYEFGKFTTTPIFPFDTNRMTVVFTHGWNSTADAWATNMARLILLNSSPAPNILAWDWASAAEAAPCISWQFLLASAVKETPRQGDALGMQLLTLVRSNYSQRIHFIGHSLGTLVNAYAADYIHTNGLSATNTHVTLFDEAEIASKLSCLKVALPVMLNVWNPLKQPSKAYHPLPSHCAWADNYITAFGFLKANAVNIILTNNFPPANGDGLLQFQSAIEAYHAYPMQWYEETIQTDAAVGYRWSFERGGFLGAPTNKSVYVQSGTEWNLRTTTWTNGDDLLEGRFAKLRSGFWTTINQWAGNVMTANGQVTGEMLATGPVNTPFADALWSAVVRLSTGIMGGGSSPPRGPHPLDGGSVTNVSAYAWIPLVVPSAASLMSFNFKVEGDWAGDAFAAAVNGTNVLLIPQSEIETNRIVSSGPIDISSLGGTTNELFVGIVGGTSSNAQLTVENIVFYTVAPPELRTDISGLNVKVSWPLAAQDFILESTTNLSATSYWATVSDVPFIEDFQLSITNPIAGASRFYRLRK